MIGLGDSKETAQECDLSTSRLVTLVCTSLAEHPPRSSISPPGQFSYTISRMASSTCGAAVASASRYQNQRFAWAAEAASDPRTHRFRSSSCTKVRDGRREPKKERLRECSTSSPRIQFVPTCRSGLPIPWPTPFKPRQPGTRPRVDAVGPPKPVRSGRSPTLAPGTIIVNTRAPQSIGKIVKSGYIAMLAVTHP